MNTIVTTGQTIDDFLESRLGSVHTMVNKTGESAWQVSCDLLKCPKNTRCVKLRDNTTVCHPEPCRRADYLLSSKLNFCFKIHNEAATSTAAEQTCNDESATLTVINSEEKMDYYDKQHLKFKYSTRLGFFIAGQNLNGVWTLPDDTVLDQKVQWSTVILNYDGPCMVFWRATGDYMLADGKCTANNYRFICEEK
ncbi:uncharacterized protein LOC110463759 isoform X2 [Mizuhopecten yessoensis]|nr:uncharacterized protein LOC110463759 isoform X2 [Mizuhopecten yessoensis]